VNTPSSSSTPPPNGSQTASPGAIATRVWLGCSGWAYPTWKPEFYPPKTSPKKMLEHYATQLSSVEVNLHLPPSAITLHHRWLVGANRAGLPLLFQARTHYSHQAAEGV